MSALLPAENIEWNEGIQLGSSLYKHHYPNLLIIGAQKAATTSVFQVLQEAKLVCGMCCQPEDTPPGELKEAHYFDVKFLESAKSYRGNYSDEGGCKNWLDASPSYLWDYDSPTHMVRVMPPVWIKNVKMVAILREPIARDLSMYNMQKRYWLEHGGATTRLGPIKSVLCMYEDGKFPTYREGVGCKIEDWQQQCMSASGGDHDAAFSKRTFSSEAFALKNLGHGANRLTTGMYLPQLERMVDHFSRKQLMVVEFGALVSKQQQFIRRIASFYGLPAPVEELPKELPTDNTGDFPGAVA